MSKEQAEAEAEQVEQSNADGGDEAQTQQTGGEPTIEERAHALGWRPKEEFRGDVSKWKDAETFIDYGEKVNPILKENLRSLEKKLAAVEGTLAEKNEAIAKFSKFHENTEKRAYERALATLKQERKEAIDKGDGEAFDKAESAIEELKSAEPKKEPDAPAKVQIPPEFVEWKEKNDWYEKDHKTTRVANAVAAEIEAEVRGGKSKVKNYGEFIVELDSRLKSEYPEMFKRQTPQSPDGGGTRAASKTGKKSFDNLVPEAKAQYAKFERNGIKITKEQYAKDLENEPEFWR